MMTGDDRIKLSGRDIRLSGPSAIVGIHQPPQRAARIEMVDALRGVAVLLFFATEFGSHALYALPTSSALDLLRTQLRPSVWDGFTLADLCFTAFLLIAGVSLALSFDRRSRVGGGRREFVFHSLWRAAGLYAIGFLLQNMGPAALRGFAWTGPLQQLAVCIAVGSVVASSVRSWPARTGAAAAGVALAGTLLAWTPFPGAELGRYTFDHNLAASVDSRYLPGRGHFGAWDPHGLITTIFASSILLVGLAAGTFLLRRRGQPLAAIAGISIAGLLSLNASVLVNSMQPWNPHLLTPAFLLAASGVMLFALAGCLAAEQTPALARISVPFQILGRNSLFAIILWSAAMPLFTWLARVFIASDMPPIFGGLTPLVRLLIEFAVVFLPLAIFYRRDLFLTV
ncbi:MAG: DUF1624 domain-containing protein [Planctomycetaceae bacterium]|nr:DUF1624 domain-containing protein [Planctomycetaceae bacterium]